MWKTEVDFNKNVAGVHFIFRDRISLFLKLTISNEGCLVIAASSLQKYRSAGPNVVWRLFPASFNRMHVY